MKNLQDSESLLIVIVLAGIFSGLLTMCQPPVALDTLTPITEENTSALVSLYVLENGQKTQDSHGFLPFFAQLQFAGQTLVASPSDWAKGEVRLIDLGGEVPVESHFVEDGMAARVMHFTLAADGRYALYRDGGPLDGQNSLVWLDRQTGTSYGLRNVVGQILGQFAHDGAVLIFTVDNVVHRFSLSSLTSPDGPSIAGLEGRQADADVTLQGTPVDSWGLAIRASFSPDGRIIVMSKDDQLRAFSTTTGYLLARLEGADYRYGLEGINFSSDGRYVFAGGCRSIESPSLLIAGCDNPQVRMWDLSAIYSLLNTQPEAKPAPADVLKILPVVELAVDRLVQSVAGHALNADEGQDNGYLVAAGDSESTQVWFVPLAASGDALAAEPQHLITLLGEAQALAFSPDHTLLAVGGSGIVTLWGIR